MFWRLVSPKVKNSLLLALFPLISTGCVTSRLVQDPLPMEAYRLAAVNERMLGLHVTAPRGPIGAGRQFILLVIPFGRVMLQAPEQQLTAAAFVELAKRGYRPLLGAAGGKSIDVQLTDVSAHAFDFLATRRIVCRVELHGELRDRDNRLLRQWDAEGRSTAWKQFAFAPQMNYVFNQAMQSAIEQLLQNLIADPI